MLVKHQPGELCNNMHLGKKLNQEFEIQQRPHVTVMKTDGQIETRQLHVLLLTDLSTLNPPHKQKLEQDRDFIVFGFCHPPSLARLYRRRVVSKLYKF